MPTVIPDGALNVNGTNLSFDLLYFSEDQPDTWLNMYSIARVPLCPGHLMKSGQDNFASGKISIISSGNDPLAVKNAYHCAGTYRTKTISARDAGEHEFTVVHRPSYEMIEFPQDSGCWYTVIETSLKHNNQGLTADTCNALGMYWYWSADYELVEDLTYVKPLEQYQESDIGYGQFDDNTFVSSYDMLYGLTYNLNLLTVFNSGGFGCGIFAVPFWGLEEPPS